MTNSLDNRTLIATMIMQSLISIKNEKESFILFPTNELAEEKQLRQIENFCDLSFKIADTIFKKSNENV